MQNESWEERYDKLFLPFSKSLKFDLSKIDLLMMSSLFWDEHALGVVSCVTVIYGIANVRTAPKAAQDLRT